MKKLNIFLFIFITRVAQEALRLRCVRSICCGALRHKKKSSKRRDLRKTATYFYWLKNWPL
jgi:hypothetical protein